MATSARVVEGSIGSESRGVTAGTLNSLEAWRVPVGGSAAQPWGLFGSGTSARRMCSAHIAASFLWLALRAREKALRTLTSVPAAP
ncbi:hypothetical protein GCM10010335_68080 [Streptomyces galbus]|nr:hypothetical protein GCM10010335_68080 [Streptomyces galbus]